MTPLAEACANPGGVIAAMLLKAGADPNSVSAEGETALMTAAHAGNPEAVKALIAAHANVNAHGADLNLHSETRGDPPKGGGGGAPLAHGGMTALLFAARNGDFESSKALAEAHADLNAADADASTGLILATMNGHYDTAAYLLDEGADPNKADKDGRMPLYGAVDKHNEDVSVLPWRKETDKLSSFDLIKTLVAHQANVNAKLLHNVGGKAYWDGGDVTLTAGTTPFIRAARIWN